MNRKLYDKNKINKNYNFENLDIIQTFWPYHIGVCTFPYDVFMEHTVLEHLIIFKIWEHNKDNYFDIIKYYWEQEYIYVERWINEHTRSVKNWHWHFLKLSQE